MWMCWRLSRLSGSFLFFVFFWTDESIVLCMHVPREKKAKKEDRIYKKKKDKESLMIINLYNFYTTQWARKDSRFFFCFEWKIGNSCRASIKNWNYCFRIRAFHTGKYTHKHTHARAYAGNCAARPLTRHTLSIIHHASIAHRIEREKTREKK